MFQNENQKSFKEGYRKGFYDREEEIKIIIKRNGELLKEKARLEEEKREYEKPIDKFIKDREAKAVKEFAEKLKKKCRNFYPSIDHYCCSEKAVKLADIDELLKEYEK